MLKCYFAILAALTTTLCAETKILAFAGSTRQDSYNHQLIEEAANLAREMGAKVTVIQLRDFAMPYYDADLEAKEGLPKNAKRLRDLMHDHDAVLIASPEYNHSVSGVLKNAIDWATRNENGEFSRDAFKGKNFGIMSASPGKKGGRHGLGHLREILDDAGATVVETQTTVPHAHKYFSETTRGENSLLKKELQEVLR